MNVLVLNAGSSSLKFKLIATWEAPIGEGEQAGEPVALAEGNVERVGTDQAAVKVTVRGEAPQSVTAVVRTHAEAAEHAIAVCRHLGIDALGHRIVHGGPRFREPVRITPDVLEGIRSVNSLAPLHNPLALQGIETGMRLLPETPAVAVFDTAFHHTLPDVASRYGLPRDFADKNGLRRYGFHGISHRYVSERVLRCMGYAAPGEKSDLPAPVGTRIITCHLGSGTSLCAIRDGHSVDTSMGYTPLAGLMMATRSGDIDPGLVLHIIQYLRMSTEEVDELLNHRSGLLGLSQRSADVRDLEEAARSGDAHSEEALESFAYRVSQFIGAYAVVLEGVDAIAFTAGIGEHSSEMRRRICSPLGFLGIRLDEGKNLSAGSSEPELISTSESRVQVWRAPTNEETQIAKEVAVVLGTTPPLS